MKLLQWNVWYLEKVENILSVIRETEPEILCLQEMTVNGEGNPGIDTPAYLAEQLGFNFFYKVANKGVGESMYGNAILSRYPLERTSFEYIQPMNPSPEDYSAQGRVYIEADIETPVGKLCVATTHLSYAHAFAQTEAKREEADKLIQLVARKKERFIFTGDLNAVPGAYTIEGLSKYLKNAGPPLEESTWTTKPFSYRGFVETELRWRLDYCFATHDVEIKSGNIVHTKYSDHLPILLEL